MKDFSLSQIKPMPGYVLVEPTKVEEKTVSGIILPENETEKPQYGKVLACGELLDCKCEDGKSCSPGSIKVKKGDSVIYKKWGGNEVVMNDVEYQFLKYEDILAIIK
ncbi:MAG: co-chaperone GroES [Candidatus Pacebacteria bacterium CG10_big_fil_rev_8_21_14_0_10_36_11]|nr:co-chaperone GroES [Candidatus Pacearchaeota archaeon]OIP73787.1 MAG: hypothetical protein AUK08_04480 [Candidatus Pacebacteria bacterium CG2_30_36_39]PIR64627.1 MAG: co-chaperone GroES [Candidatus Pacebacteria bacterium CG10_big_fil_rev_8_21_14_0_10_36_11]PJC43020.1 MAG: co-chaperone GroES [Candidatus Pacebacteria bacterium CG_4_9_14_0_2_um_filter_36_8]